MTSDPELPSVIAPRRRYAARALLVSLVLLGAGTVWRRAGGGGDVVHDLRGRTMGTTYSVKIDADMSVADRERARGIIERRLDRVDRSMSTWDSTSELSRFNRHRGTEPFEASEDLIRVLATAIEVAERSRGAFDMTVAPLVDAWGFGPGGPPEHTPDRGALAAIRERVGYGRIIVDRDHGTVSKTHPEVVVDLSAIAKGYGVDLVAAGLGEMGYRRVLVEVGGELKAIGRRRDGTPWRVGIERPEEGAMSLYATVELTDLGIATSGDYRSFRGEGSARYAHIIDPRSGQPVPFVGASVSVVHLDASVADAWATALSVLGPEEGYELAAREGIAALFVMRATDGFRSRHTPELLSRVRGFTEVAKR